MDVVGFRTRDNFLYVFPKELVKNGSTVMRDMIEAQEAVMAVPPESVDGAQVTDDAPSDMIIININCCAETANSIVWCLVDKALYMKYPKEGIPGKLISRTLGTKAIIAEAMAIAYEYGF